MSSTSKQDTIMRWILFGVFVAAFCVITICTIMLLFGVGNVKDSERALLVKLYVGGIGSAVISAVTALFYSLFRLKKTKPLDNHIERFLLKTYPRSQHPGFSSEVDRLIERSRDITLIGTGLNILWQTEVVDHLIDRAESDDKPIVRICLGNPRNPYVMDRLTEEEMRRQRPLMGPDGVESNIRAILRNLELRGNPEGISVSLFEHYPTFATLIFDRDIFIYPYGYSVLGNDSPLFHFQDNRSKEARFFKNNARRIINDATPAGDIVDTWDNPKYYSKDWITAAFCIIPDSDEPLYKLGSSILGYDIRQPKQQLQPGNGDIAAVRPYLGDAIQGGFHAPLSDYLFFATEAKIERIKAEVEMLSRGFQQFRLSNFSIVDGPASEQEIVLLCDDKSGVCEALHHELVSRVYSNAISSTQRGKIFTGRDRLMTQKYGSPYILNEFRIHFTLCSAVPGDPGIREGVVNKLRNIFQTTMANGDVEIREICLLIWQKDEKKYKIVGKYQLGS